MSLVIVLCGSVRGAATSAGSSVQATSLAGPQISAESSFAGTGSTPSAGATLHTSGSSTLAPTTPPQWLPTFGELPGTSGTVRCSTVFDDGSGPALYVGLSTTAVVTGVRGRGVARWDGSAWSTIGGLFDGGVLALAVFDDGFGPALYAAGGIDTIGGLPVNNVAKLVGSTWVAVGNGLGAPAGGSSVNALSVHDDGTGPALFAAGNFTSSGTVALANVAKWNGSSWSPVGNGLPSSVHALAVHDVGSGPELYATAELVGPTGRVWRWNGANWIALPGILNGAGRALCVHDDGSGPALYVGGTFSQVGSLFANGVAKWDGASWSALGFGVGGGVYALASYDAGAAASLYVGGTFVNLAQGDLPHRIGRWNSGSWSWLGGGMDGPVHSLSTYDDGHGLALYPGGAFRHAGGVGVANIARWDDAHWTSVGSGLNDRVRALATLDDGSGTMLYVGGDFTAPGPAQRVARWDGASWSALNGDPGGPVNALATFDAGAGPEIHAGIDVADGVVRWVGSAWNPVGGGTNGPARALATFDDGSGSALFAGGSFSSAGGAPASRVARWNGVQWASLGAGAGAGEPGSSVEALCVFDDGTGPALYAGGRFFRASGLIVSNIAKWNGSTWTALGAGLNGAVRALCVFDDGTGPALYAGGEFQGTAGLQATCIARWNGVSWSALGSGVQVGAGTKVLALDPFDDGTGPALYVAGVFAAAGGTSAANVARWDGLAWSALGSGVDLAATALAMFDDGVCGGPALYVGGEFTDAGGSRDSFIARWDQLMHPPAIGCSGAFCFGDSLDPNVTTPCPCGNQGAPGHGCASSVNASGAVLAATGSEVPDAVVLMASGMPTSATAIYLQGDALTDTVFGDGVRCAGGTLVRLRARTSSGGASQFPLPSEGVTLSQRGGVVPGSGVLRVYQVYYRNVAAAFCPPATFNATNAWAITW